MANKKAVKFIDKDFLLKTKTARYLYHNHASKMPIFDYHSHMPVKQIAEDINFDNITKVWLNEDHYKWRIMRANGIEEKFCTGDAGDYEKFIAWSKTVDNAIKSPLYHWTHLELARYFGIDDRLFDEKSAKYIYEKCNKLLQTKQFSARNMLKKMNVKVICTTDDPTDTLEHHIKIKKDKFEIKIIPTFRPEKAMALENLNLFNDWLNKLEESSRVIITDFESYLEALKKRHDFFNELGCRASDRSFDIICAEDYTDKEIKNIFKKARSKKNLTKPEMLKFKSAMMIEFALMDHAKGWIQQFHVGVLRNLNSRFYKKIGADTGFDSMNDSEFAKPLSKFLDRLDRDNKLTKTIVYNLNPKDNELIISMLGNFQDGLIPGKMQVGSAWWYLDQKDGIENQIKIISNFSLLSRHIGMLTDSRSFLSYSRHEYYRRILCNVLGNDVENKDIPNDLKKLGLMIENICFNNVKDYFEIK